MQVCQWLEYSINPLQWLETHFVIFENQSTEVVFLFSVGGNNDTGANPIF